MIPALIPVLILAGIDVVLGIAALWYRAGRNVAREQRREWRQSYFDLSREHRALVDRIFNNAREAAARRSASARHARQCQIAQDRARKAETTAKLRGGK